MAYFVDQNGELKDIVFIRAADYNGMTWDGSPFNEVPDWLHNAFSEGEVYVYQNGGCTDYAEWSVSGDQNVYGPGDALVYSTVTENVTGVFRGDLPDNMKEGITA